MAVKAKALGERLDSYAARDEHTSPQHPVVLTTTVGNTVLSNPIMTASGTYGIGCECSSFGALSNLGAFVTKSISLEPWRGNIGRNLIPGPNGSMLNSVGLANPGIRAWVETHYPNLKASGATIILSLWGRSDEELFECASIVGSLDGIAAVELNLSCPNIDEPRLLVSHDPTVLGRYVAATAEALEGKSIALWAKLAPSTADIVAAAQAAQVNGAHAVTLVNTLSAMDVDLENRSAPLSGVFGGMSGAPLHPVALRAIYQVHSALPRLPIVGVGGVGSAEAALKLMYVGASAVQVGTASFANPRAPHLISRELSSWFAKRSLSPSDIVGAIHASRLPAEYAENVDGAASTSSETRPDPDAADHAGKFFDHATAPRLP